MNILQHNYQQVKAAIAAAEAAAGRPAGSGAPPLNETVVASKNPAS